MDKLRSLVDEATKIDDQYMISMEAEHGFASKLSELAEAERMRKIAVARLETAKAEKELKGLLDGTEGDR